MPWLNIDEVCLELAGKIINPTSFSYEKAYEKEYFFKEGELHKIKLSFDKLLAKNSNPLGFYVRNISYLIRRKRYKKETRKKVPSSIKFINGEI